MRILRYLLALAALATLLEVPSNRLLAQATDVARGRDLPVGEFVNPFAEGADPWVVRDPNANRYLWCQSEGNRGIAIWVSPQLTSLGERHVVWRAPRSGPFSKEVWAPELHHLDGRWYIYFAASDGRNENHLTYVLESEGADPLGPYTLHGPMATGDGPDGLSPNIWAIDMTVLEHQGKRYALWSGWDAPGTDQQYLYIAPLASPTKLGGPRVLLCDNDDYLWERTEERRESRGLHEAPQIVPSESRVLVTYSTAASWLPTYKLGLLELVGSDPLDPASWKKHTEPVFASTESTYGVGHSCFVQSLDGSEWWHVYHVKQDREGGWRRAIHAQPFTFDPQGRPQLGEPVAAGLPLTEPSGSPVRQVALPLASSLAEPASLAGWDFYGHHQFLSHVDGGLRLGHTPRLPVNTYRSGEKLLVAGADWTDVEVSVEIGEVEGQGEVGLLVRVTGAGVGHHRLRGYMAAVRPTEAKIVIGKFDGEDWSLIGIGELDGGLTLPGRLRLRAMGDRISVGWGEKMLMETMDGDYTRGTVGVRVGGNGEGVFRDFSAVLPRDEG